MCLPKSWMSLGGAIRLKLSFRVRLVTGFQRKRSPWCFWFSEHRGRERSVSAEISSNPAWFLKINDRGKRLTSGHLPFTLNPSQLLLRFDMLSERPYVSEYGDDSQLLTQRIHKPAIHTSCLVEVKQTAPTIHLLDRKFQGYTANWKEEKQKKKCWFEATIYICYM